MEVLDDDDGVKMIVVSKITADPSILGSSHFQELDVLKIKLLSFLSCGHYPLYRGCVNLMTLC